MQRSTSVEEFRNQLDNPLLRVCAVPIARLSIADRRQYGARKKASHLDAIPAHLRQSSIQEPLPQQVFNPNTTLPGTAPNHVRSGAGSEEARRGEPGSEQKEARRGKIDLF